VAPGADMRAAIAAVESAASKLPAGATVAWIGEAADYRTADL